MTKLLALVGTILISLCAVGVVYRIRQVEHVRALAAEKAARQAALTDSAEITRGIQTYWDRKNRLAQLENDGIRLKNDQLDYDIAGLKGTPRSTARVQADFAVLENDKLAISLIDPSVPALNPYQAEARIQGHNRKYPFDKLASISDINTEMERFHSQINGIIDDENKKLRKTK